MSAGPLRVLSVGNVYPPHHLGGYEVIWRGLTRHLAAEGRAARVLTTDYRLPGAPADLRDDPDVHRELRWYWHDHDWPAMAPRARLALERHNAAVFDRHVREFQPDVVAWWAVGGMSLSLIERARRARLPAVFFVLDPWTAYGPERDLWTRMWAPAWRAPIAAAIDRLTGIPTRLRLASTGRWLFCSESMRSQTHASGVRPADEGLLAPGIESRYLEAPREASAPPWRWRLLYLGRIVEQKGVRTAVAALASLPDEATLRIIGPGDEPYRRELESLAAQLAVTARVSFEPPVGREATLDVYRDADVLIFPVEWPEPFGLVPLEAMALGRLVVATGRGGSGDFLTDGVNSLLFPAGNEAALAAAVTRLAGDGALRETLRQGGYKTASASGEDAFNRAATEELRDVARRR